MMIFTPLCSWFWAKDFYLFMVRKHPLETICHLGNKNTHLGGAA